MKGLYAALLLGAIGMNVLAFPIATSNLLSAPVKRAPAVQHLDAKSKRAETEPVQYWDKREETEPVQYWDKREETEPVQYWDKREKTEPVQYWD